MWRPLKSLYLLVPLIFLLTSSPTARALTLSEITKADLDSYADSSSVAARSYRTGAGQIELAPLIASEAAGLGANQVLSLAWHRDTLWAGGTSGGAPTISVWRRTAAGVWQSKDTTVTNQRSMAVLAVLGDTLYGGVSNALNNENGGHLLAWNTAFDTWELKRNLSATEANFEGFGRAKGVWNNTLYLSGGKTNSNTFLVFLDGATGDVDFKSIEDPPPTGGVVNDYDGVAFGLVAYPVTALGGAERLFWGPLGANGNGGNIARSRDYGTFPTHITSFYPGVTTMEVVGGARLNHTGIGDTLFILLEGGVAGNNVIYTTTDGTNFTGKITRNELGYLGGTFGNAGIGVTEAFAMRAFGRDIWIGGTLDTLVRYVGDYDTFTHLVQTNMSSGIREFEPFRGTDGETWLAIAGSSPGSGRIDRFRFTDSGTYTADTKTLATDTWLVADSVVIQAKANGCTVQVSFFFGRDTAELAARTFGETMTIAGDTRGAFTFSFSHPDPSGRASGNAWRQMIYRVTMQTDNTLITPYFEGLDLHFHQDVTAPETAQLTAPDAATDTNDQRPLFAWTASQDTVTGMLESGFDTFVWQIDTGAAGLFASPIRFVLESDSLTFLPSFDLGPDTVYLWRVLAYDSASNVSTSDTRRITIDLTAPVAVETAVTPRDFEDTTATTVTLRWSAASDTLSGLSHYIVQLESGVGAPSFVAPETWRVNAPDTFQVVGPLALSKNDTWYWRVLAYDSATNVSVSETFAFRVRTTGVFDLRDSLGAAAAAFTTRETVTIRVTDTDRNRNPAVAETIQVIVVSLIGEDTKAVTLTENAVDASLFIGVIALSDTTASASALRVAVGDTITFFYTDSLPPFTPVESVETSAATVRWSGVASVAFDTAEPRLLTRPVLTVTDPDRNRNPLLRDTLVATIGNPARGDTETLVLSETTETSGIFTADTAWISDTIGAFLDDLALFGGPGDVIELRYTDAFDAPDTALDTAVIFRIFRASSLAAVDSTAASVDSAAPNDTLSARVTDPDANLDPSARDTITLLVRNLHTGETETITLVETTETSGLFGPDTGLVSSLAPADSGSMSGTFFVVLGKAVRFEYTDASNAGDTAADTITILYLPTIGAVAPTDSLGVTQAAYARDSGFFVTAVDTDRNRNGALAETVSATVTSLRGEDTEIITLTEVALSSASFRNLIALALGDTGTAVPGDGRLTTRSAYDTLVVAFHDGFDTRTETAAFVFSRSTGILSFRNRLGLEATGFLVGETISARVADPDRNATVANEGQAETVIVTFRNMNSLRDHTETLVLTEITNLEALFDSPVGLPTTTDPADSVSGTGALQVFHGDTILMRYVDPDDPADSAEVVVTAVGETSVSLAFFTEATGVSVDTYAVPSGLLFVTIRDTDQNLSAVTAQQIAVTVWSEVGQDTITAPLTELTVDTIWFRNAVGVRLSDTEGVGSNAILLVGRPDTVWFRYTDSFDPTDVVEDSVLLVSETTASTTAFDSATYVVPETATITVTDRDRNISPHVQETVAVILRSFTDTGADFDTEPLILNETTETSGIFTATILLTNAGGVVEADGVLSVTGDGTARVDYADPDVATDTAFDTASITIAPTASTTTIFDSALAVASGLLRLVEPGGETFTVRVVQASANRNPLAVDTVSVVLANLRTGETTSLALVEIGVSAETFLSTVGLLLDPISPAGAGELHARPGDTIHAQFRLASDADSSTETAVAFPPPSAATMTLTDGLGLVRDTFSAADALRIVLVDTDRNRSGTAVETFIAVVSVPRTGDAETVTLTEASADSSRFLFAAGLAIVDTAVPAVNDGRLVAGLGDSIVVEYIDALQGDTATETATIALFLRAASARFLSAAGATVTQYQTTDSARAGVTDPNANLDPLAVETVAATLRNPRTGETEPVTLTETGAFSGAFRFETGLPLSTSPADSGSADGVLFALSSDTIEIEYVDANDPADIARETAMIRPTPTQGAVRFTDAGGAPLAVFRMDSLVFVTLTDTDQNVAGTAVETVTVTVRDAATGDSETLQLTELNPSSATFRNLVGLSLSDTFGAVAGDGLLFTGVALQVRVDYLDAFNADTALDTATLTPTPTTAILTLDRAEYAPETGVFVTVTDADRNRNPLVADTFSVTIVDTGSVDTETLLVTETSETSGVFTNATSFRLSDTLGFAIGDDTLLVALGDTFLVRYADAYDGADSVETFARILLLNTTATVSFDSAYYRASDTVGLRVVDRDRNLDPRVKDTVSVELFNTRNNDSEILTLTESDSASFTFTRDTPLLRDSGTASVGDGVLLIGAGDTMVLRFTDPANADTAETIAAILSQATQAAYSLTADSVTDGFSLVIDVIDMDRNLNQSLADTVTLREIRVRSTIGFIIDNEFQTITLTETSETSGVFRSPSILFSSQTTPGQSGNNTLLIGFDHDVEFEYRDAINGDNAETDIPVTWFTTPSATAFDRAVYIVGMRVYGEVTDTEWNRTPLGRDSVAFVLTNVTTGETETRTAYESADRSGLFRDTSGILLSGDAADSVSGTGILWARTGDTLRIDYIDTATATDTSFDTAGINVAPDSTASVTVFTSSAGDLLAAYRMDSLVFVTVTDTDKNVDGALIENVQVDVYDPVTGDTERITLTELAADTGVFRNAAGLPLSDTVGASINNGILFTGVALAIHASYVDAVDATDSSAETATLTRIPTTALIRLDRSAYAPETGVFVTVVDTDGNRNPTIQDTVTVTITNTGRADTETLVLTQTSETSGVFTNATGFRVSDTVGFAAGDAILLAALGDTFRVAYADAFDGADSAETVASVNLLNTAATAAFDKDSYLLTDSLVLTIVDRDRNRDPRAKDTLTVHVRNFRNADSETVTLTETDSTSYTFASNTLLVKDTGPKTPGDGALHARNNDTLILLYQDAAYADTVETTARMRVTPTQATLAIPTPLTKHDTFQVFVFDQDRNTNQLLTETITLRRIQVRDSDAVVVEDDEDIFILTETGDTTGVFAFTSPLRISDTAFPVTAGDTVLTASLGFRIAVEYLDPVNADFTSDTVTLVDSATVSSAAFDRATYRLGDTAYVTIVDRDENRHPLRRDTFTVTIRNLVTNETEVRTPRETGVVSFAFTDETGLLLSSLAADSISNDGRLYVSVGDTIRVEYTDPNTAADTAAETAVVTSVALTPSTIRFTDSAGVLLASYRPGDSVYLLLIDTGLNQDPLIAETVSVTLRALASPDTESVVLTEIAISNSNFRSAGIRLSDTVGIGAGDGILTAGYTDTLTALYIDPYDAGDTATVEAPVLENAATAVFVFDAAAYGLDSRVVVTATDTDENLMPFVRDTVTVVFTSRLGADTETVTLDETTETSAIFTFAGLPLSDTTGGAAENGLLMAGAADTITAVLVDRRGTAETVTITVATIRRATTASLTLDRAAYAPETGVFVTVVDTGRNRNPRLADSFAVTLVAPSRNDTETVTLIETSETSGVFTHATAARISDTVGFALGDAILLVALGDTFRVTYVDAYDGADSVETVAQVILLATGATAAFDKDSYLLTDSLVLTIVDRDRNLDPRAKDTLTVHVRNTRNGDSEPVTLVETDSTSYIFTSNSLVVKDTGPKTPGDGTLHARNNDTLILLFQDPVNGDTVETTARMRITPTQATLSIPMPLTVHDTFQVFVFDQDRNTSQLLAETITLRRVQVRDSDGIVVEDDENVFLLTETSETTGVFSFASPLRLSDTAVPVVAGDTVLVVGLGFRIAVEYLDPLHADFVSETVTIADSPTVSTASFDRSAYQLAETAYVTIVDRDENRHPLRRDTFTVIVRNLVTSETEIRTVRETNEIAFTFTDDTGLFLSSLAADSISNDGRLYVRVGDTIRVEYTDPNNAADTAAETAAIVPVAPTPGTIRFTDSASAALSSYRPGDSVYLLLIDTGFNQNPLVAETVLVTVRALAAPDTESVLMTEITVASPYFRSAGIVLSDTRGVGAADGILTAGFTDTLVALYTDPNDAGDTATATASVLENAASGAASFAAAAYGLDSLVVVTVTDSDENIMPFVRDTVIVVFTSRLGADTETVTLEETTETSAIFTVAGLPLSDTTGGSTGDGILMAGAADTITARYVDGRGTIETVTIAVATIRRATTADLTLDRVSYFAADSALLTVVDTDRNRNPRLAETIAVSIRSFATGDSETIMLTETTETSVTFTGLATFVETGLPTPGDGVLLVEVGESVVVGYLDPFEAADSTTETAAIIVRRTAATMTLSRSEFQAAHSLVITVIDADQNLRALTADTFEVLVRSHRTSDAETVVLTETAAASGIFANAGLRLSDTIGVAANDIILLIGADDTFTVTYGDAADATDSADTVGTFRRTASTAAVAFSAAGYLAGESVDVTVTDLERNLAPLSRDTVTVTVTNPSRGDTETLLCLETTETSGVFLSTTSLPFEFVAAGVPGDSRLQVQFTDVIEARYVDPDDSADTATDTAGVQLATIYQMMIRTVPGTETCAVFVSPRDASGDSIPSLEGFSPVILLAASGGTGSFLTTSETIVGGEARFVYSKLENVILQLIFQISTETYVTFAAVPAPGGVGMIAVSDQPAAGSVGTMFIPVGLFPAGTKYVVENRTRITDSATLAAILALAATDLESLPNIRLLSTASGGTVYADHEFRIVVAGVEQSVLPGAITIMISYPDVDGDGVVDGTTILEQSLRIYRLNEVTARYEIEPNLTREPTRNRVSVSVSHLTIFSVAGGPAVTDLGSLNVYPNPFEPNSGLGHRVVTFENLPTAARLRIFTADGRLVDEATVPAGSNSLQWFGNNRNGFPVASGVYVYIVESGGTRKVGKVVVVR